MKKTLFIFSFLFFGIVIPSVAQLCFSPPVNHGTASQRPSAIFSADFNGDGKADLVTSNGGYGNTNNSITLLLGTGNGAFLAPVNFSVGLEPDYMTCADFNNDGKMDVATSNFFSNDVSILLGTGTGSFNTPANYTVNSGPGRIVNGDFNGDGNKDLAVTSYFGLYNTVLLGTGTGSFVFGSNFSAGTSAMVGADFNGDGKIDLATSQSPNYYSLSLGLGNGTFSNTTSYTVGPAFSSHIQDLVNGDFNGDGKMDLLGSCPGDKRVRILFGNATGTFSTAVAYTVGTYPASIVSADFNGDGKLDFATSNCNYADSVCVRLNNGNGTFAAGINYVIGPYNQNGNDPYSMVSGDFNVDGKTDLATGNYNSSNISVLLNTRPTVMANSGTVCAGKTFTILPGGASTYTVTGGSFIVNPYVTTNYSVTGTDLQGCTSINKAIATVTVHALPNLVLSPGPPIICAGETMTLSVTGALTYTWSTSENIPDIVVTPAVQTTYSVSGTNVYGCENTISFILNVDDCVGIKAVYPSIATVKLYPNPNNGLLIVEEGKGNKITFLSSIGQEVYSVEIIENNQKINLEHLTNGVYLLRVNGIDTKPIQFKIIKE